MAVVDSSGVVLSKSDLLSKATRIDLPPLYQFDQIFYETFGYPGEVRQTRKRILFSTGASISADIIDLIIFPPVEEDQGFGNDPFGQGPFG